MTALVGTADGLFVLDTDGAPRRVAPGGVRALDTSRASVAWALLDDGGLLRRTDDDAWSPVPVRVDTNPRTILATAGGVVLGTADARLWRVEETGSAPLAGFDGVAGRDTWHAVGSAVPYVRSLTATADGHALLVSVHVGGIPRSTDDGITWEPTIDVDDDVHEVRAHPDDPSVVGAAAAVGLAESRDGGASWSVAPRTGLHATYLRALAFTDDAVVVGASDGPFGQHAALYRRPLRGGAFERCGDGLPTWLPALVDTGALAAYGSRVVAGAGDTVFANDDGARTWRVGASGLPPVRAIAVTGSDSAAG